MTLQKGVTIIIKLLLSTSFQTKLLEIHGNIHIFSTQPNEKLNDFCTQYYHRCTNKNNNDKKYILQLLYKRNRIEFYDLDGDLEDFHASDEDSDDE